MDCISEKQVQNARWKPIDFSHDGTGLYWVCSNCGYRAVHPMNKTEVCPECHARMIKNKENTYEK